VGRPQFLEYLDLTNKPARFDLERAALWYGRGPRDGEALCRVPPAQGETSLWVLIYLACGEGEADDSTRAELEARAIGRNYLDNPVNRAVVPHEASEWLERDGRELPKDLDPAPPFDAATPPKGRLARDWRPEREPQPIAEPGRRPWKSRVELRGRSRGPLVDGKEKGLLTEPQYNVVLALLEAGESGLSKDELIKKSGHPSAVRILKNLSRSGPDWRSVILLPGRRGLRYRLA
jgi:hypothetical protein